MNGRFCNHPSVTADRFIASSYWSGLHALSLTIAHLKLILCSQLDGIKCYKLRRIELSKIHSVYVIVRMVSDVLPYQARGYDSGSSPLITSTAPGVSVQTS